MRRARHAADDTDLQGKHINSKRAVQHMTNRGGSYPYRNDEKQMRRLVLLAFCDPMPEECEQLRNLSRVQWRSLLHWLDTSGLALYFLDRLYLSRRLDWLPQPVLARLEENLVDNMERSNALFVDCVIIQQQFKQASISYAVLKGISLWPSAVPAPELRSQLDLDFLLAEKDILKAQQILENNGYQLHAVSGGSWEFKTPQPPSLSIKDLYKNHSGRCVELHVERMMPDADAQLDHVETRLFKGYPMPVLPPVELFLGVSLHLYKHVCSEAFRCAHLVEFRREVLSHCSDNAFWNRVRARAENNPRERLALGVVTLLATHAIGPFAPETLTSWTVDRLPTPIRLWVETHGLRSALASFPGSKLYLLLQRELEAEGVVPKRSVQRALLPLCLPPPIACESKRASVLLRIKGSWKQFQYICLRLRFHIVEGLRYAWEAQRWRRQVHQLFLEASPRTEGEPTN
jgi:hypothetical protein